MWCLCICVQIDGNFFEISYKAQTQIKGGAKSNRMLEALFDILGISIDLQYSVHKMESKFS